MKGYNVALEKFKYDMEMGAVMDFVEDRFMLVIKDESWSQEELDLLKNPMDLHFCYTQDIAIFVLEGGDIDSSDFYFNIQDCDWKDACLNSELVNIDVYLLNGKKQAQVQFMQDEYDVNVLGIQSAYQPYELNKYAVVSTKF